MQNIIIRGFAEPYYKKNINITTIDNIDGIILNKEGLLLGEVIYIIEDKKNTHYIYSIYRFLMEHFGAWVLLIIFSITFFIAILFPFFENIYNININIYSGLIKSLLNIIKHLFSLLPHLF